MTDPLAFMLIWDETYQINKACSITAKSRAWKIETYILVITEIHTHNVKTLIYSRVIEIRKDHEDISIIRDVIKEVDKMIEEARKEFG